LTNGFEDLYQVVFFCSWSSAVLGFLAIGFQQFEHDVLGYGFLQISSAWGSFKLLGSVDLLSSSKKNYGQYFFKYFFQLGTGGSCLKL
jgi:hypothetical protein